MSFDISRYKPEQVWFICYPNMKHVSYEASGAVVPVQFDFCIKTQCLRNVSHFLIRAEGIWGIAYLSLRPRFENSCNKDPNRIRITAGIIWDVTVCRWVSVSRRWERTGCLHFQSLSGQRKISCINAKKKPVHTMYRYF
jgi:hypothetical protein